MPKLVKSPSTPQTIPSHALETGQIAEIVESGVKKHIGEIAMCVGSPQGSILVCLSDGGYYSETKTVRVLSPEETITLSNEV